MDKSTKEQAQGKWEQIKGSVKEKYGDAVNDKDLEAEGNVDQLIGTIHEKTGETKDQIKSFIDSL
jgi:uncharacterized protein YjbJ (UPF0337 family)